MAQFCLFDFLWVHIDEITLCHTAKPKLQALKSILCIQYFSFLIWFLGGLLTLKHRLLCRIWYAFTCITAYSFTVRTLPSSPPFSPFLLISLISVDQWWCLPESVIVCVKFNIHVSSFNPTDWRLVMLCFFTTHCSLRLIVRSELDVPTFATRRLHACHHVRAPSGGRWNCGREMSGNFA